MKAFELSLGTVILRFYLMMLIVIAAGFIGQWWLAVLALPVFLSIMAGITFSGKRKQEATIKEMSRTDQVDKKAV
ncbi:MAG: hypothetical protein ACK4TA_17120 [Saprospiraceae bacterium]